MPDTDTLNALIGYSGFVGSSLQRQGSFEARYRSADIQSITGRSFDTIVCAGAPAQKWLANQDPAGDWRAIERLIEPLRTVRCKHFVLVSTVDVFQVPVGIDESVVPVEQGLHPYGLHRLRLEHFVQERFDDHLIVRLPGLVGPGLRKNVIYDLLNENNLHAVDSRSVFQFYPMVNLWPDVLTALRAKLQLVHLTAEPLSVAEVAEGGFGRAFNQEVLPNPAKYDLRTHHAHHFGGTGNHQYSRRESLLAIRAYAQSEPRKAVIAP